MTPESATDVVNEAREALAELKGARAKLDTEYDNRVRVAFRLGICKAEIHELSGISRSAIDRILGHQP